MSAKFWARQAENEARQNAERTSATIAAMRAERVMRILDLVSRMLSAISILQCDGRQKTITAQ